jgi:hypothetical protein
MTLPSLSIGLLVLLYFPIKVALRYRYNLKAAKASGLPYSSCPVYIYNRLWLLSSLVVVPMIKKFLPTKWQGRWSRFLHPEFGWIDAYRLYQDSDFAINSDSFMLVSPELNMLFTADPEVIIQLTTRRADFPKPTEIYDGLRVFGDNVVTTEGATWRRHRKNTNTPFGERNNRVVWKESIFQADQMIQHWTNTQSPKSNSEQKSRKGWGAVLSELSHDTMRLSLYVISRAGFDVRCEWPDQISSESKEGVMSATEVPKGHKMSYMESLETLLLRILAIFMAPLWLLGKEIHLIYFPYAHINRTSTI